MGNIEIVHRAEVIEGLSKSLEGSATIISKGFVDATTITSEGIVKASSSFGSDAVKTLHTSVKWVLGFGCVVLAATMFERYYSYHESKKRFGHRAVLDNQNGS